MYRSSEVSRLPWYTESLDRDIGKALEAHGPAGVRVLDLGTGPGTHAVGLARLGFEVTGVDISKSAIASAKTHASNSRVRVDFRVDNILESDLEDERFDVVVDRGMFHVLPPDPRPRYVATVHRILKPRGMLYLKTFSDQEPGDWGPYRFSPKELRSYFRDRFHILSIRKTVFGGTLDHAPRALFATLRRR